LKLAQSQSEHLTLWTFQKNAKARAFYERHGFVPVEFTDGLTNQEREPDVRYVWDRRDPR
jgi:GNAT superfamily N-acetyltransferase